MTSNSTVNSTKPRVMPLTEDFLGSAWPSIVKRVRILPALAQRGVSVLQEELSGHNEKTFLELCLKHSNRIVPNPSIHSIAPCFLQCPFLGLSAVLLMGSFSIPRHCSPSPSCFLPRCFLNPPCPVPFRFALFDSYLRGTNVYATRALLGTLLESDSLQRNRQHKVLVIYIAMI
jgi:hypothetical protein